MKALDHDYYMGLALERARLRFAAGDRPIYSLVVQPDGSVAGEAGNTVARDIDPSAHAEVNAIRIACTRLGTVDLSGCTLYTPLEPCPMCLATILEARISTLVLGARHRRVGRADLRNYSVESYLASVSKQVEVVPGVREQECEALRLEWKRLSREDA